VILEKPVMIEDYIPLKKDTKPTISRDKRDSFSVYSGLRGTFIQVYKSQIDEKA
jgi:hypothetical protein